MNHFLVLLAIGAGLLAGCAKDAPHVMSIAGPGPAATIRSGVVVINDMLAPDTDYSTGMTTVMAVNVNGALVGSLLIGPWPPDTGTATIRFVSASNQVQVSAGWAYFIGRWPLPQTVRIVGGSGAAGGLTGLAAEYGVAVDVQGDVQRMYCLALPLGHTLQAMHTAGGPNPDETLTVNQYVSSVPDGGGGYRLNDAAPIPVAGPISDLMAHIQAQKRLAGLP